MHDDLDGLRPSTVSNACTIWSRPEAMRDEILPADPPAASSSSACRFCRANDEDAPATKSSL